MVTFCPAGRWLPGSGDCWRAIPLPTTLISRPLCCATSTAVRRDFPINDGTTIPLSTSSTTVPFPAAACAAVTPGDGSAERVSASGEGAAGGTVDTSTTFAQIGRAHV